MELNPVVTEQTTAASDAVLAVIGLACALWVRQAGRADPWRGNVWSAAFGLAALGAALGAAVHGFRWSPGAEALWWRPLYLALALSIGLMVVGVVDEAWGRPAGRRTLPAVLGAALGFHGLTVLAPGGFLLFALVEASAMGFAVLACGWLTLRGRRASFALMTAGMALSLLAAVAQTQHALSLTVVWRFDHNGVFHLIQMPGLLALAAGLVRGARAPGRDSRRTSGPSNRSMIDGPTPTCGRPAAPGRRNLLRAARPTQSDDFCGRNG